MSFDVDILKPTTKGCQPVTSWSDEDSADRDIDDPEDPWELASKIEAKVPGLKFGSIGGRPDFGGACPWQAHGTLDGRPFYARYRSDTASMSVWDADPATSPRDSTGRVDLDYQDTAYSARIENYADDPLLGILLGEKEITRFFNKLIARLKPTDPDTNPNSAMVMARWVEAYMEKRR
jgi:hypothetical protein